MSQITILLHIVKFKIVHLSTSLPRQESSFISIWPPFFQHQYDNRRLSRQNAGGACLYIPNNGHWATNFEVIPPPKKLALPLPKKENSGGKPSVSALNFQARTAFFLTFFRNFVFCHSDLDSREQQARSDPTRLIQPCPIGCDRGSDQPVTIFPFFALFFRNNANKKFLIGSPI